MENTVSSRMEPTVGRAEPGAPAHLGTEYIRHLVSVTAPQVCHLSMETQHDTIRTEYPNKQRLRKGGGDQAKEKSRDGEQSWSHPPRDCDYVKGQYPGVRAVKGVPPRYP